MFSVSVENDIVITRGDNASFALYINQGTPAEPERYELRDDDEVCFAVMEKNQVFEEAMLSKFFYKEDQNVDEDLRIVLTYLDTENILPGKYFYTIKLKSIINEEIRIQTLISNRKFCVVD